MSTVGVKELKNRLTQYLRRTRQGEEVVVTDRGTPIALIQPIESATRLASLEARLARLAAQGRVTPPTRRPLRRVRLVRVSGSPVSQAILEDRRWTISIPARSSSALSPRRGRRWFRPS